MAFDITPTSSEPAADKPEPPPSRGARTGEAATRRILYLWAAIVAVVLGYAAFDRFLGGEPARRFASIAVLPFDNIGGDPADEYFSDGVTEDIIAQLTKLGDLKVISRTSIMLYKNTRKPVREIAQELEVATILQGSVRRQGDQVRVVASLVDARSDSQLWAETYDRQLSDIFVIRSDLAEQIAHELLARIARGTRVRLSREPTQDFAAYELYLKGRWFWYRRSYEALTRAAELFEQAIAQDSAFALAYAGLADVYVVLPYYHPAPQGDEHERAFAAAEQALRIDPNLGEAHAALGYVRWHRWDWEAADQDFRRAIELNPGYATAHEWYGLFLAAWGKPQLAEARMAAALRLDPLSLAINAELGLVRFYARRYDEAITQLNRTREMDSTFALAYTFLARAYEQVGRYGDALAAYDSANRYSGTVYPQNEELRGAFERAPNAENYYLVLIAEGPPPEDGGAIEHAYWNAALGRVDAAINNLELALRNRELLVAFIAVEPAFDVLRDDPRFQSLLQRMNTTR